MNLRNVLLGTTAMLGAAALIVPSTASAFDVNINGFANFNVIGGDIDEALGRDARDTPDFTTDTEIHIQGVNTDDETGIRYGITVEFEADPQAGEEIDESWIFIDGGFGGFRLGNEDGAVDNMKLGAYAIAAGTGGIDGQGTVGSVGFAPTNSGDSTKIRYDSPSIGGLRIGVSYTPAGGIEGNNQANEVAFNAEDWLEGGLVYTGSFGGLDLRASGVVGANNGNNGADDLFGWNVGAVVGFSGISVAGSFWDEEDGPAGDRTGYTAGVAAAVGPANLSLTWAHIVDVDGPNGEGTNLVGSASMGVLPGLSLHGDVSFFDKDQGGNDDGVSGVARLRVAF